MAEDYLTDDEQLEHVKRVVAENWVWVAGGVLLGAALIFGYRYYENSRNELALRAAAQFDDLFEERSKQIGETHIVEFRALEQHSLAVGVELIERFRRRPHAVGN